MDENVDCNANKKDKMDRMSHLAAGLNVGRQALDKSKVKRLYLYLFHTGTKV